MQPGIVTVGQTDPRQLVATVQGTVGATQGGKATYVCNTGTITGATATGVKSLAYLWHPSSAGLKYRLARVRVNQIAGAGAAGSQRLELNRITAENAAPGGSSGTILGKNAGNNTSAATVRIAPTGAPTRASGVLDGGDVHPNLHGSALLPGWGVPEAGDGQAYELRAGNAEGYEVVQNVVTTLTTAPTFNITFEWTESSS